jgi:hypothetical protein
MVFSSTRHAALTPALLLSTREREKPERGAATPVLLHSAYYGGGDRPFIRGRRIRIAAV